jgi:hypothetical protein
MAPLWGIFGLGPLELIILALLGLGGPLVALVVVVVVLTTTKKSRDPEEE